MNYLALDTESTGAQRPSKGSALDPRNRLCYIGHTDGATLVTDPIEFQVGTPYGAALRATQAAIDRADILVLFNAKHDLHWLRRYGIRFQDKPIWDCQLAEFIIHGQQEPFPSLHNTGLRYGGHGKSDFLGDAIKRGLDTDEVSESGLREYLEYDVQDTAKVFLGQIQALKESEALYRLIWNNCQDEIITEEMEWNGLKFDIKKLIQEAIVLETNNLKLDEQLHALVPGTNINWESPKQVSAVLYGGDITTVDSEAYLFHYANDKKPPVVKYRKVERVVTLPRLVEPLARTESSDGKAWSTETKVLKKLKAAAKAKEIIGYLLERRGTQTQIDRYFRGIPRIYQEMGWEDEIVHGRLHHVVASTGRLSSSEPNQQNIDKRARHCLMTRFKT